MSNVSHGGVLVALDGSSFAEQAIPYALAVRAGRELILMRASDPYTTSMPPELLPGMAVRLAEALAEESRHYLKSVAQLLEARGVPTRLALAGGHPRDAIVEAAREWSADMIVMCSHGRSGVARWLLGSIAEAVLRRAPCPVLLVRAEDRETPLEVLLEHPLPCLKSALVPLDGSDHSETALPLALSFKPERLVLLRATDLPPGDPLDEVDAEAREGMLLQIEAYLRKVAERTRAAGLEVGQRGVDGGAAETILEAADLDRCNLVTLATHGRTGLQRYLMGSVAERVLRHARCPVLVTNPQAASSS
ncbi:MAG: universal stress protein [Candidatus Eremiobacterota bacterium]